MELERQAIERKDFPAARRGYDPEEVDRHLREIADSVAQLKRARVATGGGEATVAGAIAEQVRSIVEAAEQSAGSIEDQAEQAARQIRGEAERDARQTRESADSEAADHIRRVEEATRTMLGRARAIDDQIETMLSELRTTAGSLVERVETTAASLASDLESIRAGLGDVREARAPDRTAGETLLAEVTDEPVPAAVPDPEAPGAAADEELDLDYVEEEEEEETFASEVPEEEALESTGPRAVEEPQDEVPAEQSATVAGGEGARLIALNMALNGTPREETAKYLAENFDLADQDAILDEVYSRVGG